MPKMHLRGQSRQSQSSSTTKRARDPIGGPLATGLFQAHSGVLCLGLNPEPLSISKLSLRALGSADQVHLPLHDAPTCEYRPLSTGNTTTIDLDSSCSSPNAGGEIASIRYCSRSTLPCSLHSLAYTLARSNHKQDDCIEITTARQKAMPQCFMLKSNHAASLPDRLA